jgi:hypothetical protein
MAPVRFQAPSRSNVKKGREIGRMRFFEKNSLFFNPYIGIPARSAMQQKTDTKCTKQPVMTHLN